MNVGIYGGYMVAKWWLHGGYMMLYIYIYNRCLKINKVDLKRFITIFLLETVKFALFKSSDKTLSTR